MISLERPPVVPAVLQNRGVQETASLAAQFDQHESEYRSGARTFTFRSAIYGHPSVKRALLDIQHHKCAFCEAKVTHVAHGDVEHFRPKGGYQQSRDADLSRPGYYWLAYDWSNLLFACQLCNQSGKKNVFPLSNPRSRAFSHRDSVVREKPMLLNPADLSADPVRHIGFRQEIAYPVRSSRRGGATIEVLGLNREALREHRRDRYATLEALHTSAVALRSLTVADPALRSELEAQLAKLDTALAQANEPVAEYACMARSLYKEFSRRTP